MYRLSRNAAAATVAGLLGSQPAMATRSVNSLPQPGAERAVSPMAKSEELGGGFIIPLIAIIAIILGILAVTGGDGNKSPG